MTNIARLDLTPVQELDDIHWYRAYYGGDKAYKELRTYVAWDVAILISQRLGANTWRTPISAIDSAIVGDSI